MKVKSSMVTVFVVRPGTSKRSFEFLQLMRAKNDDLGGTWQIVRGGIKKKESAIDGALRELKEETRLKPREFYRLDAVESFYTATDDTLWHGVPFVAIVDRNAKVRINEEHEDFRWVPRAKIKGVTTWSSEIALLDVVFRTILDNGPAKKYLKVDLKAS